MARRGGFQGGMPGNMNNLMKQAQKMQRQMEVTQKEMEEKEYEATAGGGAVTVKVSGKKEVLSVKLSEEVVDPDDIEMLEDLIVAATNEALRQLEEDSAKSMEALTGGLNLGGGFNLRGQHSHRERISCFVYWATHINTHHGTDNRT